jgi:hypothetical protein
METQRRSLLLDPFTSMVSESDRWMEALPALDPRPSSPGRDRPSRTGRDRWLGDPPPPLVPHRWVLRYSVHAAATQPPALSPADAASRGLSDPSVSRWRQGQNTAPIMFLRQMTLEEGLGANPREEVDQQIGHDQPQTTPIPERREREGVRVYARANSLLLLEDLDRVVDEEPLEEVN